MPHISKKELPIELFGELFYQLVRVIDSLNTVRKKNDFLWNFFTQTEKVMLAKRLAIIIMLSKNASQYEVSQRLNVSSSTVARIADAIDRGRYTTFLSNMKVEAPRVFDIIDSILTVGGVMPRYTGRRRKR